MQQTQLNRCEKIILGIKGFFWVAGLIMAGSDGNFMPWVNGAGVFLFAVSSFSLGMQSAMIPSITRAAGSPGYSRKPIEKKKQRVSFFVPVTNL